ncbi:MAG TPA: hypothetical protein VF516_08710, partial [Kofleriaceae bacterium]
ATSSAAVLDQTQRYAKDSVIVRFRSAPTAPFARTLATRVNGAIEDRDYPSVFRAQETAYRWSVCEQAGLCSNEVSVDFGPDPAGDQATMTTEIGGTQVVEGKPSLGVHRDAIASGP